MARLIVAVEGQTEEQFVNRTLCPHLTTVGYHSVSARLMGNARARTRRGGIRDWQTVKKEVANLLKEDSGRIVSTMVDYYALPNTWPNRDLARTVEYANKANVIQSGLVQDLVASGVPQAELRFKPLVMMHEFEAFAFLDGEATADATGVAIADKVNSIRASYATVEMINDSAETAPSKRLLLIYSGYNKILNGNDIVSRIGLDKIRASCPHFDSWLTEIESICAQNP